MKIKFGHLKLVYPVKDEISIEFSAETQFEIDYLASLITADRECSMRWIHPDATSLNAVQMVIKLKEKASAK